MTAYSSDYIIKCMQSYFFDEVKKHPDLTLIIFLIGLIVLEITSVEVRSVIIIFWFYGIFLMAKIILRGRSMWQHMKVFWIWWNKPQE